jgi:glucose/mannose-6-phosphate isomerase
MDDMKILLDDPDALRRRDAGGMLLTTYGLADQVRETTEILNGLSPLPTFSFRRLLFCGTGGGSRSACDLVRAALWESCPEPFPIFQGYGLPGFVNKETLVFVLSHSGDTEEAISNLQAALPLTRQLVIISGGGALEETARKEGLFHIHVPLGMEARSAIGYLTITLLVLLERLFSLPTLFVPEVWETLALEREGLCEDVPLERNVAKQAALTIHGRIPFIYGSDGFTDAVAERFRRQLAENGKTLSHTNRIPAMHHDEIVGFEDASWHHSLRQHVLAILLRDLAEERRLAKRFVMTAEVLREKGVSVLEMRPLTAGNRLTRLFSLVQQVDYVSIYCALGRGYDPRDVAIIRRLKEKMRL